MLAQFPPVTLPVMLLQDVQLFFRSWTCDPLRVGAIAPSGPALAAMMTGEVSAASSPVIELGPGTGVFTRALLERGVAEHDITLVEFGSDFVSLLERRFPQARVLQLDAAKLSPRHFSEQAAAGVICG